MNNTNKKNNTEEITTSIKKDETSIQSNKKSYSINYIFPNNEVRDRVIEIIKKSS